MIFTLRLKNQISFNSVVKDKASKENEDAAANNMQNDEAKDHPLLRKRFVESIVSVESF